MAHGVSTETTRPAFVLTMPRRSVGSPAPFPSAKRVRASGRSEIEHSSGRPTAASPQFPTQGRGLPRRSRGGHEKRVRQTRRRRAAQGGASPTETATTFRTPDSVRCGRGRPRTPTAVLMLTPSKPALADLRPVPARRRTAQPLPRRPGSQPSAISSCASKFGRASVAERRRVPREQALGPRRLD